MRAVSYTHLDVYKRQPTGITHHFAGLGIVGLVENKLELLFECRNLFPSLTAIEASDVSFDGANCPEDLAQAQTVQDALKALCARSDDGCALSVVPGKGWERVFERVLHRQDAHICFKPGEYALAQSVLLKGKGHIRITGSGPGTRIIASTSEAALAFTDCLSVTVSDLYAETGIPVGAQHLDEDLVFNDCSENVRRGKGHLNGVLTFQNCAAVTVENAWLRCAGGSESKATCITVRNSFQNVIADASYGLVRIRGCDMAVGHMQTGILLVNARRAHVEDNRLSVVERPQALTLRRLTENKNYRAKVRRFLIADATTAPPDAGAEQKGYASVTVDDITIRFNTDSALQNSWDALIRKAPPPVGRIQSSRDLQKYVETLADRVLLDEGRLFDIKPFRDWYVIMEDESRSAASQGIVIGGRMAPEVRVVNNTIDGVLEGIHVGLSHCQAGEDQDTAGRVQLTGNTILVVLPPIYVRERFGIFVGHCQSLLIDNNFVQLWRSRKTSSLHVEGIRVFGTLGRMAIIRQNHLANTTITNVNNQPKELKGFTIGVHIRPLNPSVEETPQWLVSDNLAARSREAVRVEHNANLVKQSNNLS